MCVWRNVEKRDDPKGRVGGEVVFCRKLNSFFSSFLLFSRDRTFFFAREKKRNMDDGKKKKKKQLSGAQKRKKKKEKEEAWGPGGCWKWSG